jgi:hypothetical protein
VQFRFQSLPGQIVFPEFNADRGDDDQAAEQHCACRNRFEDDLVGEQYAPSREQHSEHKANDAEIEPVGNQDDRANAALVVPDLFVQTLGAIPVVRILPQFFGEAPHL